MTDDTRAGRLADQADPARNRQFRRGWDTPPPAPPCDVVTGPESDEAKPAHGLAWHAKPKAIVMREQADRQWRASWWTK